MRVLFVTTRIPYPPRRGDQVRSWNLLRHLASRHEITLAAISVGKPAADHLKAVEDLGVEVRTISLSRLGSASAVTRGVWDSRPFQVLLYDRRRARRKMDRLVDRGTFDLVHGQLVRSAPYLPAAGPPAVIDLIDALSANFAKRATYDRAPAKWLAAVEARRLDSYEASILDDVAAAVVVSAEDRDAIGDASVEIVPNGVDLDAFVFDEAHGDPDRIVFAGALGYFPNVDAATFLVHEVMPHVWWERPEARLQLVGARPTRTVRALADGERVLLDSDVDDVAPHVAAAAVSIIPMRAGSGMQNKIVEAMALGTPVVTTSQAAKAVGAVADQHVLVAREPEDIAAAALAMMEDPDAAAALASRARRFVEERFRWQAAADAIDAIWEDVAR